MPRIRELLAAALLVLLTGAAVAAEPVTVDNFRRAETDHYFLAYASKGCFAKLCNEPGPAPVDKQNVVRMNRDTPYSVGIFDLTSPLTITKPDTGKRFQSMQIINQDHYIPLVAYDAGTYVLTQEQAGTRYVAVLFRTFMDPNDAADVKAAHAAQGAIRVAQVQPGKFEVPEWDQQQRAKLSAALGSLMAFVPDSRRTFGKKDTVDPVRHLIGTAAGWGGNPVEDATYISGVVKQNDGKTPYLLTVRDVPVAGFWSVTVYNAKGLYEAPENAISVNNVTGKRNADGSMTIRFGGDPAADNYLRIMPGWNYTVRLYRPRPAILDGKWTFPEPTPVH
ncbi:MAG: DUF1214 domain-containing protein [Gammaproteobacteria bacterium]|nr:DUF1214 domain-containing protein [Gammaproteobacteria bacterium]